MGAESRNRNVYSHTYTKFLKAYCTLLVEVEDAAVKIQNFLGVGQKLIPEGALLKAATYDSLNLNNRSIHSSLDRNI